MKIVFVETTWIEQRRDISLAELAEASGLSEEDLRQLADEGALQPVDPQAREWLFPADSLRRARTASRLRRDFELDTNAIALALALLDRVRELEQEVTQLRAGTPGMRR